MLSRVAAASGCVFSTVTCHNARALSSGALYTDPNFPVTEDGRVHHLDVKPGEVANRVLSVGDPRRAAAIAANMTDTFKHASHRGFVTFTGNFEGERLSVIATGMGTPMMDFVVRETRAVVDGPMAMLRYGTCGGFGDAGIGDVAVCGKGSALVRRDPDLVHSGAELPYLLSDVVQPDADLAQLLRDNMTSILVDTSHAVRETLNVTTDSFYSSQARVDPRFDDRNTQLVQAVWDKYKPGSMFSCEMETFQLLDLAKSSAGSVRAAASAIVLANREAVDPVVLTHDELHDLERRGGEASLRTLAQIAL